MEFDLVKFLFFLLLVLSVARAAIVWIGDKR